MSLIPIHNLVVLYKTKTILSKTDGTIRLSLDTRFRRIDPFKKPMINFNISLSLFLSLFKKMWNKAAGEASTA